MDEAQPKKDSIDLSSLEGLTLGTAWSATPARSAPSEQGDRPARRFDESRGPRDNRGDNRGPGPRREFNNAPRKDFGSRDSGQRDNRRGDYNQRREAAPVPPSIKVVFYPEEAPFKALTKAIKASMRTYELFEISRLILEKPERTVATLGRNPDTEGKPIPFYQSIADEAVFLTEAEALQHAAKQSLEKFFKVEEVEAEAPKGNFVVIHRCGITGKLIAPPNYHRYAQLLTEHQIKNCPTMTIAAVQARLETVKEPELIAAWLESMKKITRYTLLVPPAEGQPSSFDGEDAAKAHLATNFKAQLVKTISQPRLTAKQIEALPPGEIKRSIEVSRAMQMKFPLETANNLRGRLRRMNFNIYKRGTKGVSYLSAVKRRFRTVGQAFAPEVQRVIEFIEKTPNVSEAELPKQLLGISVPVAPKKEAAVIAPTIEGAEEKPAAETPSAPVAANTPAPVSTLSPEEDAALRQLRQTLQWLIEQGYVILFGNGKLFVPPARQPNAPKTDEDEEDTAEAAIKIEDPAAPSEMPTAEPTPQAGNTPPESLNKPTEENK